MKSLIFAVGVCLFSQLSVGLSATVTWGTDFVISSPADISSPASGVLHAAFDYNSTTLFGPDDAVINGIPFARSGTSASPVITNFTSGPTNGAEIGQTFFPGGTGDPDLDSLLNSHAWSAGSPSAAIISLSGLDSGSLYQVQLISVADFRGCCSSRTYEPDDGEGNYTTGLELERGQFESVIGTFTADSNTQTIRFRSLDNSNSNNDPGLSGIVVFQVPEPGTSCLVFLSLGAILFRRRRRLG